MNTNSVKQDIQDNMYRHFHTCRDTLSYRERTRECGGGERERENERHRGRHSDSEREADIYIIDMPDRHIDSSGKQTDIQNDRATAQHTDTHTHRHTHIHTHTKTE